MNALQTPWPERALIVAADPIPLDVFTEGELATARSFKLHKRREEWLLSRFAAKTLAVRLGAAEDPRACEVARPMLGKDGEPSSWYVSLSHSAPWAGAAISREPVGLDVQVVRDLAESAAHFFLTAAEMEEMSRRTLENRLLHYWCAKEAAWKRRSDEFRTLKQVPLRLQGESERGLRFDSVETALVGNVIVAITLPTS